MSYLSEVKQTLKQPSASMTWTQLAASVIFVGLVALAWRQVTLMIMREV